MGFWGLGVDFFELLLRRFVWVSVEELRGYCLIAGVSDCGLVR